MVTWEGGGCWSRGAQSDTRIAGSGWCHRVGWPDVTVGVSKCHGVSLRCPDTIVCGVVGVA